MRGEGRGKNCGHKKTRSFERVSFIFPSSLSLRQNELYRRLYREVIALENRDGGERSVLALRAPALLVDRVFLALERLAAHRRGEHPPLAPAPDLLAGEILHHEIVSLSVGELQLEHLAGVVLHVESEAKLVGFVIRSRD